MKVKGYLVAAGFLLLSQLAVGGQAINRVFVSCMPYSATKAGMDQNMRDLGAGFYFVTGNPPMTKCYVYYDNAGLDADGNAIPADASVLVQNPGADKPASYTFWAPLIHPQSKTGYFTINSTDHTAGKLLTEISKKFPRPTNTTQSVRSHSLFSTALQGELLTADRVPSGPSTVNVPKDYTDLQDAAADCIKCFKKNGTESFGCTVPAPSDCGSTPQPQ